jgi:hypothetical protein
MTVAAVPRIVNAPASHSSEMIRRSSAVMGPKLARTWRAGTACATAAGCWRSRAGPFQDWLAAKCPA